MRPLRFAALVAVLAASSPAHAQLRSLEPGVFAGPFVQTDSLYTGSVAAGVRVSRVFEGNAGRAVVLSLGYVWSDAQSLPEVGSDRDTVDVRLFELAVGYRVVSRGSIRLEPTIGVAFNRLDGAFTDDDGLALFTTGLAASFTPTPSAPVRPWIGVEGRYYGLIPFESDGLYQVALTASLDFSGTGGR